jgi:F0F1-type ATP synthase alpha subunit
MARIVRMLLDQNESEMLSVEVQVILFSLVFTTFSSDKQVEFFIKNRSALCTGIREHKSLEDLRARVRTEASLDSFLRLVEKQLPFFNSICQT